jgi:predicted DNA binding CopG/RHH family protein
MSKVETMTAERLDRLVDEGKEEVLGYFDLENVRRGGSKRINIDLPADFLHALDKEAAHRGITRQSLIKVWLYDRLRWPSSAGSFEGPSWSAPTPLEGELKGREKTSRIQKRVKAPSTTKQKIKEPAFQPSEFVPGAELTPEQREALEQLSEHTGRTVDDLIAAAVDRFLLRERHADN